jgi:hypothetical protein
VFLKKRDMTIMDDAINPRVAAALAELRLASEITASPGGVAAARGAMHRALEARGHSRTWLRTLRLAAIPAVALLAVATAGASAAGAPPGSPLHVARQAEEEVRFDLAGDGRARLGAEFAREHLDDVRNNGAHGDESLTEAKRWVDRAKQNLFTGDATDRKLVEQVSHEVDQQEGGNGNQ